VLSLTLYQPCVNIFIALLAVDIVILAVKNELNLAKLTKLIFNKAILFISFVILYMLFFSSKNNSRGELIPPNREGMNHLFNTISSLKDLVTSYFHGPVYIYFLIPVVITLFVIFFRHRQNKNKILPLAGYFFIAALIFLASLMGPTIFLKDAPVAPRAITSFSAILIVIAIPAVYFLPRMKYISLIPVITCFAFSAQLSSALKSQREYEEFVFNMVAQKIISYKDIDTVRTVGQVNIDERAKLLEKNKPLIRYFLSPASEFLASFQLINKGLTQTKHGYGEENDNRQQLQKMLKEGIIPVVSNSAYSLYIEKNTALVKLGSSDIDF